MRRLFGFLVALSLAFTADHAAADAVRDAMAAKERGDMQAFVSLASRLVEAGEDWTGDLASELGDAYTAEKGLAPDYAKAVHWYAKAGPRAYALGRIGVLYRNGGNGLVQDLKKSFRHLHLAALLADSSAGEEWIWKAVGKAYLEGRGTKKNKAAAFLWLERAAYAGDAQVQGVIGQMYGRGSGIVENLPAALWWLKKAAANGDGKARDLLGKPGMSDYKPGGWGARPPVGIEYPFGVALGKKLLINMPVYPDLSFGSPGKDNASPNKPTLITRLYIEPPAPAPAKMGGIFRPGWPEAERNAFYVAFVTAQSGTVYRMDATFTHPESTSACRQAMEAYIGSLTKGHAAKVLKDWQPVPETGGQAYQVMVDGPREAVFHRGVEKRVTTAWPFEAMKGLARNHPSAVSVHASCPAEGQVGKSKPRLTFIHLPSLVRRIAESFKVDPYLLETFNKKRPVSDAPRPAYHDPFGVALGKSLLAQHRKGDSVTRGGWVDIAPSNPHRTFNRYSARITTVSDRVREVSSSNLFDASRAASHDSDYAVCTDSLLQIMAAIAEERSPKELKWFWEGEDHLYSRLKFEGKIEGKARGLIADIQATCERSTRIEGFREIYGQQAHDRLWRGTLTFSSDLGEVAEKAEECALNPEVYECWGSELYDAYAQVLFDGKDGTP